MKRAIVAVVEAGPLLAREPIAIPAGHLLTGRISIRTGVLQRPQQLYRRKEAHDQGVLTAVIDGLRNQ